jgi:hypothetical protein
MKLFISSLHRNDLFTFFHGFPGFLSTHNSEVVEQNEKKKIIISICARARSLLVSAATCKEQVLANKSNDSN